MKFNLLKNCSHSKECDTFICTDMERCHLLRGKKKDPICVVRAHICLSMHEGVTRNWQNWVPLKSGISGEKPQSDLRIVLEKKFKRDLL